MGTAELYRIPSVIITYTITGNLFTGILCSVALFLIVYRGYDLLDNVATSLAGYFAFGIAMYPTNDNSTDSCAIFHLPLDAVRNCAHYGFSVLFFITLACISLFLFTKSRDRETKRKKIRNKIYKKPPLTNRVTRGIRSAAVAKSNAVRVWRKDKIY